MQTAPNTDQKLHKKLPIDGDENILALYKHHWFAYLSIWFITLVLVACIFGMAALLTGDSQSMLGQYRGQVLAGAGFFGLIILLAGIVPAYLKSCEQLVLTDEAILQVLQPTLFSSKVDQLSLQHINDISVHQDFFGTILGYGKITIETPGEQDNYDFYYLPNPREAARQITAAKEDFDAALQGGRLQSTLGASPQQQGPTIDPEEFQEFLQFQQMQKMQQQATAAATPSSPSSDASNATGTQTSGNIQQSDDTVTEPTQQERQ